MRILPNNIAVLDGPDQLSRWVEESGRLCHDDGVALHYLPHIKPGDVVIDAGAAIGDHTIAYLERVGPSGVVHAFEANPLMLECLQHNCPRARIHPVALASKSGSAWIDFDPSNVGAGAIFRIADIPDLGSGMIVKTLALDQLKLDRVDFIKMDIEGSESAAIVGGFNTIIKCRPKMIVEVYDSHLKRLNSSALELEKLIRSLGYTITPIMGDPKEGRYEALCLPE